jgi:hypothetical protein
MLENKEDECDKGKRKQHTRKEIISVQEMVGSKTNHVKGSQKVEKWSPLRVRDFES